MSFKDWLCGALGCCTYDSNIPPPNIVGNTNWTELHSVLKSEYGESTIIMLSDNNYKLATLNSFKDFLSDDNTNYYHYTGDPGIDCDNFAEILAGRTAIPGWGQVPIGTCWLSNPAHAVNIFVDENITPWLCEPQTDGLFRISDKNNWKAHIIWL